MEEGRPSLTAVGVAMMRAAHLLLDDGPKILEDSLALAFSGAENEAALRANVDAFLAGFGTTVGMMVAISAYQNRHAVREFIKKSALAISQSV